MKVKHNEIIAVSILIRCVDYFQRYLKIYWNRNQNANNLNGRETERHTPQRLKPNQHKPKKSEIIEANVL